MSETSQEIQPPRSLAELVLRLCEIFDTGQLMPFGQTHEEVKGLFRDMQEQARREMVFENTMHPFIIHGHKGNVIPGDALRQDVSEAPTEPASASESVSGPLEAKGEEKTEMVPFNMSDSQKNATIAALQVANERIERENNELRGLIGGLCQSGDAVLNMVTMNHPPYSTLNRAILAARKYKANNKDREKR